MKFIEDKELNLNEAGNDLLNGKSYSETLKQIIQNAPNKGTFTIGLFGEWGSGKSSIIKTVKDDFNKHNEYKGIKFITYDAWKYVNDSFRRMFLLSIQKDLGETQSDLMERFYCNKNAEQTIRLKLSSPKVLVVCAILFVVSLIAIIFFPNKLNQTTETISTVTYITSLIGLLVNLVFKCFSELKTSLNIPMMFAPEQFEDCFKDIISKALKKNKFKSICNWIIGNNVKNDKIVIVIDNIDRCSSDTAYHLLTDIKNFMGNYDNLIFIIPIDDGALKKHLIKNNGSNRDAEEFLRKFFNVEIRIKPLENIELQDFAEKLNEMYNFNFRPDTISIIANDYATNPRRVIQLYNNLTSEINILSKSNDKKFLEENEAIICKALIIREEWPNYYKLVLNNNNLLKVQVIPENLITETQKENRMEIDSFLRRTFFLTQNVDISVIEKILSNKASFQNLPNKIVHAISSFDIEKVIEYIDISEENKDLCVKYLLDRLDKSIINKSYRTEVIKMFATLISINKHSKLSNTYHLEIQTRIVENINKFIQFLPTEYFSYLANYINGLSEDNCLSQEIGKYFNDNIHEDNENLSEHILNLYEILLTECNNISLFRDAFLDWYKKSNKMISSLPLQNKMASLVCTEFLTYKLDNIQDICEEKNGIEDIKFIIKYGNLNNEQIDLIINKINSKIISYNGSNKSKVLSILNNITGIISVSDIKNVSNFQALYNKIFKGTYILTSSVSTQDDKEIIIKFLEATYIATRGLLNTNEQLKTIFDKDYSIHPYIISSIKNICAKDLLIGPFSECIFKIDDISEDYLYILERIIKETKDGQFTIADIVVETKLKSLIKQIHEKAKSNIINNFLERCLNNNRFKRLFIHTISLYNKDTISALSPKLQEYAFDTVCKNIDDYENEKGLLESIAISKNKEYISCLIQLIIKKLAANHQDEFWKALYEKVDSSLVSKKDKNIITALLAKEIIEE